MLKKAQIKFTPKAFEIAKQYFIKKKATEFLIVLGEAERAKRKQEKANEREKTGDNKANPSKAKEFYSLLVEAKQTSKIKIYTTDIAKALKLFKVSLIKEGRLSYIFSPTLNCILYISKDENNQKQYKRIIVPSVGFPKALLNETNDNCINEFESKMMSKSISIDLADLILEIN